MPPNRKATTDIVDGIADLRSFVAAPPTKYPTLTTTNAATAESYWDWPNTSEQSIVERIQTEEKIRNLLSADHIAANLVQESAKREADQTKAAAGNADSYWDMPTEEHALDHDEAVEITSAQHIQENLVAETPAKSECAVRNLTNAYWEWPTLEERQRLIQSILEAERVRQHFTIETVEQQLLAGAGRQDVPSQLLAANDSYWVC